MVKVSVITYYACNSTKKNSHFDLAKSNLSDRSLELESDTVCCFFGEISVSAFQLNLNSEKSNILFA